MSPAPVAGRLAATWARRAVRLERVRRRAIPAAEREAEGNGARTRHQRRFLIPLSIFGAGGLGVEGGRSLIARATSARFEAAWHSPENGGEKEEGDEAGGRKVRGRESIGRRLRLRPLRTADCAACRQQHWSRHCAVARWRVSVWETIFEIMPRQMASSYINEFQNRSVLHLIQILR